MSSSPAGPTTVPRLVEPDVESDSESDDDGPLVRRRLELCGDETTVQFEPDDHTTECLNASRHYIIAPEDCDLVGVRSVSLPNPRTGRSLEFLLCRSVSEGEERDRFRLFELQRHKPRFSTWACADFVEPATPLLWALPYDCAFLALFVVLGSERPQSFIDFEQLLLGNPDCAGIRKLPTTVLDGLREALRCVCEVKCGGDQEYFRFDPAMTAQWFVAKHAALLESEAFRHFALGKVLTGTPSQEGAVDDPDSTVREKACRMLLEYVPAQLHAQLCESVQVDGRCRTKTATAAVSGRLGTEGMRKRQREDEEEIVVQKKAPDFKSAALRRLEKAGPPKGTPTLFSFLQPKSKPPPQ